MTAFWKDKQARMAVLLLTVAFAVLTAVGYFLLCQNSTQTARGLLRQDIALAGGMERGKSVQELSIFTGKIDEQDLAAGNRLLSPYGYSENTPPAVSRYYGNLFHVQATLFFACAALLYLTALFLLLAYFAHSDRGLRALARHVEAGNLSQENGLILGESGFDVLRSAIISLGKGTSFRTQALQKDKEYLRDLLSDISHQMKTPIAALSMYHELLAEPGLSTEKRNEFLKCSQKQVERTNWLVQSLLKMARLEAGSVMMNRKPAYLLDTVELAAAPFREPAVQKGVELAFQVPAEIRFSHDADWVAEAVGNLIKNALEHTHSGGHILVAADETPLSVELCVKDDGEGVASEEIPHAFERFYRKDRKKDSAGAGIGLSLAKEIIEKNGGDIFLQSSLGKGSIFTVTFLKGWHSSDGVNLKKS